MRSAFTTCFDAGTLHDRSVSGQLPTGWREPEPAAARILSLSVVARYPASALVRLADRARWTEWA
jgi:hypothetical protein